MIYIFLAFWLISALLIILEDSTVRIIIYLGIFSLFSSVCFLMFGAPDVAMAEAAVNIFTTIFFIVCFEKKFADEAAGISPQVKKKKAVRISKILAPILFVSFIFGLFIYFIPQNPAQTDLKELYLADFGERIGGENAVTSIYLGYRVFDTLFEALMLLVSVVAVAHLSWYHDSHARAEARRSMFIKRSDIATFTIRLICPMMLLFGAYLTLNGHITPGGGFQGGVVVAAFFICRYMIYDIHDIRAGRVITAEKLIYTATVLVAVVFIFFGANTRLTENKELYLVAMNILIGLKVACGFLIIFYRYIAFERRDEKSL